MKIAILILSHVKDEDFQDPRVTKAATALAQAGHEVVVLGTGKEGRDLSRREVADGFLIIRQITLLQRLYNRLAGGSATTGLQGDRLVLDYREKKIAGFGSRLLARLLMVRHNLNLLLFYFMVIPEAIRQRADVYVGYDLPGLRTAALAALVRKARLVYDSAELWTERVRGMPYCGFQKSLVAWEEKRLSRRCDLVITMSNSVARILSERYAIPEPLVIRNIPPLAETSPSPDIRALLTRGKPDRWVVVYVGFLDYGRGLVQLVDAAEYLEGVTIALLGDGVLRPALEERIKEKRLDDKVHLVGWVPRAKVLNYVASADVGVSAVERNWLNPYYTLDNKLFDYIMAGIPLAVSDHPEKRALVERYGIGVTFDERDPRDIARAIQSLLADPVRYAHMRANCLRSAREELNWEMESQKYVAAIEALMQPHQLESQ